MLRVKSKPQKLDRTGVTTVFQLLASIGQPKNAKYPPPQHHPGNESEACWPMPFVSQTECGLWLQNSAAGLPTCFPTFASTQSSRQIESGHDIQQPTETHTCCGQIHNHRHQASRTHDQTTRAFASHQPPIRKTRIRQAWDLRWWLLMLVSLLNWYKGLNASAKSSGQFHPPTIFHPRPWPWNLRSRRHRKQQSPPRV